MSRELIIDENKTKITFIKKDNMIRIEIPASITYEVPIEFSRKQDQLRISELELGEHHHMEGMRKEQNMPIGYVGTR